MKSLHLVLFWIGLLQYKLFGKTNKYSYFSFRKLHGMTNGAINKSLSQKISKRKGKYSFPSVTTGITGALSEEKLNSIVSEVEKNGFYIFPTKLDSEICDEIKNFSLGLNAKTIGEQSEVNYSKYDRAKTVASMYKYESEDILKQENIQSIFYDLNFIRIAQSYLGCKPLNNSILMWWSALYNQSASSKAAQLYHFDMDHPKFIKFFIYLTDVDTNSGPHCFIRGTNRNKPLNLREDRRFSETEIKSSFDEKDIVEIIGNKGTIVAVDTSGIHKGKLPISQDRLIVQLEYTNSFFGQKKHAFKAPAIANDALKEIVLKYQEVFDRLSY